MAMLPVLDSKDIAIVQKALLVAQGLTSAARQIGGALLDHYNRTTGQCDPGRARLQILTGLSDGAVKKAIAELVRLRLFNRDVNGGHRHSNSYRPFMGTCRAIVADWDARMAADKAEDRKPKETAKQARKSKRTAIEAGEIQLVQTAAPEPGMGTKMPNHMGTKMPATWANLGPQTNRKNLSNLTIKEKASEKGETFTRSSALPPPSAKGAASCGLGNAGALRDPQSLIANIVQSVKPSRPRQAAEEQAQKRIADYFNRTGGALQAAFYAFGPTDAAYVSAVDAEMKRRGDGVKSLMAHMGRAAA